MRSSTRAWVRWRPPGTPTAPTAVLPPARFIRPEQFGCPIAESGLHRCVAVPLDQTPPRTLLRVVAVAALVMAVSAKPPSFAPTRQAATMTTVEGDLGRRARRRVVRVRQGHRRGDYLNRTFLATSPRSMMCAEDSMGRAILFAGLVRPGHILLSLFSLGWLDPHLDPRPTARTTSRIHYPAGGHVFLIHLAHLIVNYVLVGHSVLMRARSAMSSSGPSAVWLLLHPESLAAAVLPGSRQR